MRAVQDSNAADFPPHPPAQRPRSRRAWREPVVASGVLTSEVPGGGAAAQRVVRVVNLSPGGAGLVSVAPLSVGTEYRLDIAGRPDRSGRVRIVYCRQAPNGFDVGTEYLDPSTSP
jgi:hypothetical protein